MYIHVYRILNVIIIIFGKKKNDEGGVLAVTKNNLQLMNLGINGVKNLELSK